LTSSHDKLALPIQRRLLFGTNAISKASDPPDLTFGADWRIAELSI
jgi:hypothetical protein